jgi:hypothetical protein
VGCLVAIEKQEGLHLVTTARATRDQAQTFVTTCRGRAVTASSVQRAQRVVQQEQGEPNTSSQDCRGIYFLRLQQVGQSAHDPLQQLPLLLRPFLHDPHSDLLHSQLVNRLDSHLEPSGDGFMIRHSRFVSSVIHTVYTRTFAVQNPITPGCQ